MVGNRTDATALFWCPACEREVVKRYHQGLHIKTCGCKAVGYGLKGTSGNLRHGFHGHLLYSVWSSMNFRCSNPKAENYERYGGRGISVCPEWQHDAAAFISWALANGWKQGLTLDRRENDGNYCPENCQFVTNEVNSQKRCNARINLETAREIVADIKAGMIDSEISETRSVPKHIVHGIRREGRWKNAWS